jgi:hypothetical protein
MISIDVRREFLNKRTCLDEARRLISEGLVVMMNEKQLASEIYFHALAFYFCEKTGWLPRMKYHADPIDLHDGGDKHIRRVAYAAAWKIPGRWK